MRLTTTVAVIGATGTAGSRVVARLRARGVAVVEACRTHGVDVVSGQGLSGALEGVDVVIDVSNPMPTDRWSTIAGTLLAAARNVVAACTAREIERLVVSTIACVEDPVFDGLPYCEAKRAAKEIVLDSPVPATIVKSTPWYESVTHPIAVSCNDDEVIAQDWLIQPIAADTVADVLVEAALGQAHRPRTITGPHAIRLPELASKLLARQGDARPVRAVPPAIPALAAGALLAPSEAIVVGPDVDTWLETCAPDGTDGLAATATRGRPDFSHV